MKADREEDDAEIFYEDDQRDIPSHLNHPFYVIAKVRDVELKTAMLDQGSSLDIISLSVLCSVCHE